MNQKNINLTQIKDFSHEDETVKLKTDNFDSLIFFAEQNLRRLAHNFLRRESINHSFQTIDLVNETLIKLIGQRKKSWQNPSHFMALSAKIMRRILINHARDKVRQKRAGGFEHCSIDEIEILTSEKSKQILDLEEALQRLEKLDSLKSQIVELRFFAGLTVEETARELGVSPPTVWLHWRFAKAWLSREISPHN